jgi:hypothetical protein
VIFPILIMTTVIHLHEVIFIFMTLRNVFLEIVIIIRNFITIIRIIIINYFIKIRLFVVAIVIGIKIKWAITTRIMITKDS